MTTDSPPPGYGARRRRVAERGGGSGAAQPLRQPQSPRRSSPFAATTKPGAKPVRRARWMRPSVLSLSACAISSRRRWRPNASRRSQPSSLAAGRKAARRPTFERPGAGRRLGRQRAVACGSRRDVLRLRRRRRALGRRVGRDSDPLRRRCVDVRRPLDRLHRRLSHRHVGGRGAGASFRRRAGALRLRDHLRRELMRAARRLERGLGRHALIIAGFLGGVVDVLMNAEGARIERRLGRPILARLHAAASAGMTLGAILGV